MYIVHNWFPLCIIWQSVGGLRKQLGGWTPTIPPAIQTLSTRLWQQSANKRLTVKKVDRQQKAALTWGYQSSMISKLWNLLEVGKHGRLEKPCPEPGLSARGDFVIVAETSSASASSDSMALYKYCIVINIVSIIKSSKLCKCILVVCGSGGPLQVLSGPFFWSLRVSRGHVHARTFWKNLFTNASRVLAMAWASVRLSVTLLYCIKTVQARITKFLLWAAPKTPVYRDEILYQWARGFPSNKGVKERHPLKRRYFAVVGSSSVKTVADRYIRVAYHNKHWSRAFNFISIDDLERPWTPKIRSFRELFVISGCDIHFKSKLLRRNVYR